VPRTNYKQRIREDVLRRKGLRPGRYAKLSTDTRPDPGPLATPPDGTKTLAMRLIEQQLGVDLREVLLTGSLSEVADLLGIDQSTVSKWIKRLGLRDQTA
jgi:hypothetical protein